MLAKAVFQLLTSFSFAIFGETFIFSPSPTISDAYPPRGTINLHAQQICEGFQRNSAYASKTLKIDLTRLFNAPVTSLQVTRDELGGRIKAVLASTPVMHLNIVYNGSTPSSLTFIVQRPLDEIEPVSRISLGENCRLFQAYHTYYNHHQRPFLRIRTDARGKEILRVKMEETPTATSVSADGLLKVGFIDSGLDYNHPALVHKSRPLLGIDLTNPDRPPFDYTNTIQNELMGKSYAHGTAVADVATRDLSVHIIPVRIENKSSLSGKAVEYLAQHGVRLVNISQGSWREPDWLDFQRAALAHPEMLFIVSAGNDSTNIDVSPTYPAAFEIPNMIVVASINSDGKFSDSFSNYGPNRVDVAAFGERVVAARAGGGTSTVSGTSFAAPQVTRLAAKFLINQRDLSTQELKTLILQSARATPHLEGRVRFGAIDSF